MKSQSIEKAIEITVVHLVTCCDLIQFEIPPGYSIYHVILTMTFSLCPCISFRLLYPDRPRVISVSARIILNTSSTPSSPPTVRPYINGRATMTTTMSAWSLAPGYSETLTKHALGAESYCLNNVATSSNTRVEKDSELVACLCRLNLRRSADLI